MSILEKPQTMIFKVTEYKSGCDAQELVSTAARLASGDEYLTGRLDDGYGIVEWCEQDHDEVNILKSQLEAITDSKTAEPF